MHCPVLGETRAAAHGGAKKLAEAVKQGRAGRMEDSGARGQSHLRPGCCTHVSTYSRYAAVGAIVGGVTVAIREAVGAALPADTPVYYSSSVLLAYAAGIVLSYYGHRRFTFGDRQLAKSSLSSFSLFTLIALLGLAFVAALSVAIRYGFGADQILGRYGAGFAFALATLLASILTYALNFLYTFHDRHGMAGSGP
jgi:putative flippase GtrA